ncbi:MAG: CIA30 family protein, partial [Flavobacteriaceae bacterium]|nr:CIA30 family protein [Flavobacteriaceae bacterium]
MKAMIVISIILSLFANNNYKIDFGKTTGGQNWMIVNDDVMGGLSNSTAELTDSTLIFKGTLSLKNNGGFASIRSKMSSL